MLLAAYSKSHGRHLTDYRQLVVRHLHEEPVSSGFAERGQRLTLAAQGLSAEACLAAEAITRFNNVVGHPRRSIHMCSAPLFAQ